MSVSETNHDERLLATLFKAAEDVEATGPEAHPDEEMLALFAAGALDEAERQALLKHLDECVACRKAASALLSLPEEESAVVDLPRASWLTPARATWLALAASLLVAVGLVWSTASRGREGAESEAYRQVAALVADGKFDDAARAVSEAKRQGVLSDRLVSLRSETTRRIPDAIALAYAGRLSDFGYEPGGIVARAAEETELGKGARPALEQLQQAGSGDLEVLLNRGHALLTLGSFHEGLGEFDAAVKLAPANALAWLGRGLANFMLDQFDAAADDFRKSLELDPSGVAAKMNLAMTLDELGERKQALSQWRTLLNEPLSARDRRIVERAIEELSHE